MAVRALRVGYLAVAASLVGVILVSSGGTPWVLAAGVVSWLGCAAITLTCLLQARRDLSEPRPGFWSVRWMIIHDTVHTLPPIPRS
jgi:hypothetical protein